MQNGQSVLRKALPLVIILGLAIGGALLLVTSKPQAPATESEEKVWAVATQNAQPGLHIPVISLYGRIESAHVSRLTSALSTDVLTVLSHEGERVRKGQPLVQLDDRDAQLRLKQRSAELAEIRALLHSEKNRIASDQRILNSERQLQTLAQQAVERAQQLKKDKLTAQAFIDEAQQVKLRQDIAVTQRQLAVDDHQARLNRLQAQQKKAESLLALATLDVERTTLSAPFDARITQLPASPGNHTRPGELLVELYDLNTVQIRAQIPTTKLAAVESALATGQPLIAIARTAEQQTLPLHLSHLAADIKAKRGGRDGLFTLDSANHSLAIGGIVALQLQLPAIDNALALPREALYGDNRIYSIVDGRLKSLRIERLGVALVTTQNTGRSTGKSAAQNGAQGTANNTETRHLLVRGTHIAPGDVIVTTQLPNAIDGLKVRAREAAMPRPATPPSNVDLQR